MTISEHPEKEKGLVNLYSGQQKRPQLSQASPYFPVFLSPKFVREGGMLIQPVAAQVTEKFERLAACIHYSDTPWALLRHIQSNY